MYRQHLAAVLVVLLAACLPVAARQEPVPPAAPSPLRTLELGKRVPAKGETDERVRFRLPMRKGEFVRVAVFGTGADVVPRVMDPTGSFLVYAIDMMVHSVGRWHVFELPFVAPVDGDYLLEAYVVRVTKPGGAFDVLLEERREAVPADRELMEALVYYANALKSAYERTAGTQAKGIEMIAESIERFRALGLKRYIFSAYYEHGVVYSHTGRYREASDAMAKAVEVARASKDDYIDPIFVGLALGSITICDVSHGYTRRAIEVAVEAVGLLPDEHYHGMKCNILMYRALAYKKQGDWARAAVVYDEIAEIARRNADASWLAVGEGNAKGARLGGLTNMEEDIVAAEASLKGQRVGKYDAAGMKTLVYIATLHSQLGEYGDALDTIDEVLELTRGYGFRLSECDLLLQLGHIFNALGRPEQALAPFGEALTIARENDYLEQATFALSGLAHSYVQLGNTDRALALYAEALPIVRDAGLREMEAHVLSGSAGILALRGETERALEGYERALAIYRDIGVRAPEAWAHLGIAKAVASKDPARARAELDRTLELARSRGDRRLIMETLYQLAVLARDTGDLDLARSRIEEAIDVLERIRVNVPGPELRMSYFSSVRQYYELYVEILMQQRLRPGRASAASEAFRASERGRARVLLEMLVEQSVDLERGADPALLERERDLRRRLVVRLDEQVRLAGRPREAGQEEALHKEIAGLERELDGVRAELRAKNPAFAALTAPEVVSVERLQREALDAETVVVSYALGDRRSWVWVVAADGVTSAELPGRAEVEARAQRVRELLVARSCGSPLESTEERVARVRRADAEYAREAQALSRMVLGPVAKAIAGKRLAIVADGALQFVPFDALPEPSAPERWLVEGHEVAMLPSATALVEAREQAKGRAAAKGAVAVVADPVFEATDVRVTKREDVIAEKRAGKVPSDAVRSVGCGDRTGLERLPGSRAEAEAIGRLVAAGEAFVALDFGANLEVATSGRLGGYRMVHFATHGFVPSQAPELSGLVLSLVDERGAERAGYLGLSEIYGLKLSAEVVVLSACETGLGRQVRGEGIVGLTRGFMYAGSRRVVASLWKVDDRPTSELMQRFYERMLRDGRTPSAALREAKLELVRGGTWKAPYYWAAFQLYGEWR